uniref:Exostosin GT47 domain-containing protein n=1 Tax=Rhizophora mucronata TaxID=61149 RepID=A0A2P2IVF1_RHIMU
MKFPYWNRTLGADHFYVSGDGLDFGSDRNLLELKKNSIQISRFPAPGSKFVPHKDITLPPFAGAQAPHSPAATRTARYLGFVKHDAVQESTLVKDLGNGSDFIIESEPSDERTFLNRLASSEFCLFEYGADMSGLGEALRFGCIPVLLTNRPILDLPLMDVLRWREIAIVVGSNGGAAKELKSVLGKDGTRERKREFGVRASQHFTWNQAPKPYDAFHMVMYQLWLRRHTIRYARMVA